MIFKIFWLFYFNSKYFLDKSLEYFKNIKYVVKI